MITDKWQRIALWAAGLVAAAAALYIVRTLYDPLIGPILGVLAPFSVAVGLALLLDPAIERIAARGMSRGAAVALVALVFLSAVGLLGFFLVPAIVKQGVELGNNLPKYYDQAVTEVGRFMSSHQTLLQRFHLPTNVREVVAEISARIPQATSTYLKGAGGLLAVTVSKAIWLILIPIITVFLLMDVDRLKAKALLIVPERQRERTSALSSSVGRVFGAYIRGLILVAVLYGIACGLVIAAFGVPYAVVLGAVAGILSLVPYVGTISTLLLVAVVAVVHEASLPAGHPINGLWVALAILAVNQIFDNLVGPKLLGRAVGVHPALAILALLIGGKLFGLSGMILAVPITASIQIIVLEFCPSLRGPEGAAEREKVPFLRRVARLFRRPKKATEEQEPTED